MLSYLPENYQWPDELSHWNVVERGFLRDKEKSEECKIGSEQNPEQNPEQKSQKFAFGLVNNLNYSKEEQERFSRLYNKQLGFWDLWASEKYLKGLALFKDDLKLLDFKKINEELYNKTGFVVVGVNGLLTAKDFFELLANRIFPVTWWLRSEEELDYIVEPDLFHDLIGHVPMLMLEDVADFMVQFGRSGFKKRNSEDEMKKLNSLYWFTSEFGLIKEKNELKIWGAGILSSNKEMAWSMSNYSKKEDVVNFDKLMGSSYRIDEMQPFYFVLPHWEKLKEIKILLN